VLVTPWPLSEPKRAWVGRRRTLEPWYTLLFGASLAEFAKEQDEMAGIRPRFCC
jgi:hypothetical protein